MAQNNTRNGVLVVDGSFSPATQGEYFALPDRDGDRDTNLAIDLPSDTDPYEHLDTLLAASAIRVNFPSSADGRGFSIASALRGIGYRGHLRAKGHVLADQYPLALRSGFDDVEISAELAKRQPEHQWADALTRMSTGYRERLMRGETPRSTQAA